MKEDLINPPENICILDIETKKTNFNQLERSEVAFAGIRTFKLKNDKYYAGNHSIFFVSQMKDLEGLLIDFPGLIIGHNIFQFDYRVLKPLISLRKIIRKTFDTLVFVYLKNNLRVRGLSLNSLSKLNFGREKLCEGRSISKLWREGKRKFVIKYNRIDCNLTKAVWWQLLHHKDIRVQYYDKVRKLTIQSGEVLYLTGQKSFFTYTSWNKKLDKDGYIIRPKCVVRIYKFGSSKWLYCSLCKKVQEINFVVGFKTEVVKCPICGIEFAFSYKTGGSIPPNILLKLGVEKYHKICIPKVFQDAITPELISSIARKRKTRIQEFEFVGHSIQKFWDRYLIS